MGYRTYIGELSKEEHEKIKNLSLDELYKYYNKQDDDKENIYISVYEIANQLKYTEFDDDKFYKHVFDNKETQDYFNGDSDFWIVEKEYLEHIINHYHNEIKKYYHKMLDPFIKDRRDNKYSDFLFSVKMKMNNDLDAEYTFDFNKITPEEQTALYKLIEHTRSMGAEWGVHSFFENTKPFDLTEGNEVTHCWKYEYNIFELVRIYKTFDWNNKLMIYYGW